MFRKSQSGRADEPNPAEHSRQKRIVWKRRLRRWLLLFVAVPYLAVTAVFTIFQRQLLYPAARQAIIDIDDAHLPEGQVHELSAESHDGLSLNGWLILAEGQTAETPQTLISELAAGRTVILYFPGNSGNRLERVLDCRDFTSLDCDVVLFD